MFSPLKQDFDLSQELNGKLLESINLNSSAKAKIFIPALMQNMSSNKPIKKIVHSNGLGIFKNTEGRPNISSAIIYEKNYIESNAYGNQETSNSEDTLNLVSKNITRWVSPLVAKNRTETITRTAKKGTVVRCTFLNSKISKLSYVLNTTSTKSVSKIS